MEKITFSRTDISEETLLMMIRTSELVKQLNNLTLADFSKKQDIVKELFGDVGNNPFLNFHFFCNGYSCLRIFSWPSPLLAGLL